jgi:hypothetical protein
MNNRTRIIAIAIAFIATTTVSFAQTAVGVIERGLNAYLNGDAPAALKGWLQGSAMEGNTQATSQANMLRQIEDFYGKPESYQVLSEQALSERSRMVYFVINFAKGPAYARMQVYKTSSGSWVATEFRFHTDSAQILPAQLVFGQR